MSDIALSVREARSEDAAFIVDAVRELAVYEKLLDQFALKAASLEQHLFGDHRYAEALIGELDGRRAGYALFFFNYSTFLGRPGLYLEDLLVLPADRGRGLGRVLLTAVAGIALERGCGRLDWSVLAWNEPAKGFYRSLGAEISEDWRTCRLEGASLEKLGGSAPPVAG